MHMCAHTHTPHKHMYTHPYNLQKARENKKGLVEGKHKEDTASKREGEMHVKRQSHQE